MDWMFRACLLLSMAGLGLHAGGQQPPPEQKPRNPVQAIRVNVNLVQTDVMVFDRAGRFIDNLTREQFELYVDGKPQPVAFFELVSAGSPEEEKRWSRDFPAAQPVTLPPPATSEAGRSLFFFVDDYHLSADSVLRVRKSLLRSIDRAMGVNDQAAIVLASGQAGFLEQLTENKQVLRSAVSKLNYVESGIPDREPPLMQEYQALAIEQRNSDVIEPFVDATMRESGMDPKYRPLADRMVRDRAAALTRRSAEVTQRTLGSLANLVEASGAHPGRKLVFFLSDGFILQPQASSVFQQLARVTDAASQAGIVIYTIDARGLMPDLPDASVRVYKDSQGRLSGATGSAALAAQDGLYNLAAETGGRFLHNTNALDEAMYTTLAETSRYYLLGWHLNGEIERSHKRSTVSVSVPARPDLTVRVRKGSLDLALLAANNRSDAEKAAAPGKQPADPLVETIKAPYPGTALRTFLYAARMHEANKGWRLVIAIGAPGETLKYEENHGKRKATVEVLGLVLNQKGQSVASFRQKMAAEQKPSLESPPDITYSRLVPVEPGLYQVRVAIRDQGSGQVGSAYQWIEVPAFTAGQLSLSSIFFSAQTPTSQQSSVSSGDLNGLDLDVSHRYPVSSQLYFVVQIYNAARRTDSSPPEVTLAVRLYRGSQAVVDAPPRPIETSGNQDPARISYGARFGLAGLPAGLYYLEIRVTDRAANSSAVERASLTIH